MWSDYRNVETVAVAAPIAEAVTTRMACDPQWQPLLRTGGRVSARVRAALGTAIAGRLPARPQTLADVIALGLPAYQSARAAVLDLVYAGYQLAQDTDAVKDIARAHHQLNALSVRPADLTGTVRAALEAADCEDAPAKVTWDSVLATVSSDLLDRLQAGMRGVPAASPPAADGDKNEVTGQDVLSRAWNSLLDALASLSAVVQGLAANAEPQPATSGQQPLPPSATAVTRKTAPQSTADRRLGLAVLIRDYLTFLYPPDPEHDSGDAAAARQRLALRLTELHAAVRVTSPVYTETEQRLELVQASADTRTMLAPNHSTAASKLTGLQLHHFAAFYKGTWRANDWMWGRLDGAGWLTQIVLDPRRILAVVSARNVAKPVDWFFGKLRDIVGSPGKSAFGITDQSLRDDLAFLDHPDQEVPASLPNVTLWVALALQRYIAAEELTAVAGQIRNPANGPPRGPVLGWLDRYDTALAGKPSECPGDGILDPANIYKRLDEAGVPSESGSIPLLGGLEALLGKAPVAVRNELGYLQKGEQFIPPALNALQSLGGRAPGGSGRPGHTTACLRRGLDRPGRRHPGRLPRRRRETQRRDRHAAVHPHRDPGPRGRHRGRHRDRGKATRHAGPDHLHGPDRHDGRLPGHQGHRRRRQSADLAGAARPGRRDRLDVRVDTDRRHGRAGRIAHRRDPARHRPVAALAVRGRLGGGDRHRPHRRRTVATLPAPSPLLLAGEDRCPVHGPPRLDLDRALPARVVAPGMDDRGRIHPTPATPTGSRAGAQGNSPGSHGSAGTWQTR